MTEERGHECAFTGSGRSGDADDVSPTGQRKERIQRLQPAWVSVFDQGRQAWQRPSIRALKSKEEVVGGYHNGDGRGALSRMKSTIVASRVPGPKTSDTPSALIRGMSA